MRIPRSVLLVPAGAVLVAAAVASGSCTSATGPSFPSGAQAVPPSFATASVAALPPACAGQSFFEASTSLCTIGVTYFLCDGSSYTEYACADPGSPWTLETLSRDEVGSGPGSCAVSTDTDGGAAALEGTVFVVGNMTAPGENAVLAFRYCGAAVPQSLVARYSTGGSGAADLDNTGVLDADQQLAVNATQTLLFAVNQGSDSIAVFHIADDGSLTAVAGSPFPSGGTAPASVGVSGDILVVANKSSDGIRKLGKVPPNYATFQIQADGSLSPAVSTFVLPLLSSPTQVYVAPGGDLVFTTDESGVVLGLQLSPAGDLTLAPGSPVSFPDSLFTHGLPHPVWPAGLSASPTQSILYTGIPNNQSIAVLEFNSAGQLSYVGGEDDPPTAELPCWSVVNADGSRLYFANAGSDSVTVWDTASDPRHPHALQTFALPGGGNPWGLRLDPTGQLLFVITPRQVHQIPEGQGQLLHGLQVAEDGTLSEIEGSPVAIPIPGDTNAFGVAVVAGR